MKRISFLMAVAITASFFVSCNNAGKSDLPIPKDAVMVLHLNTSSLTSKVSLKDLKESSWFQEMAEDAKDSFTKKIFENPESSGVDMKSDFAFFIKKQGQGGYMVFEGKISNASAFEDMVKNMKKITTVPKDGDLKYVELGKKTVLTWSDARFFVINDAPLFAQASPFNKRTYGNQGGFTLDSLRKFTKDLLALKSDNSIEKNERFASLMKESGDVHLFINTDQFTSSMGGGMMSMLKMNTLFEGNSSTMTLNFEDGKVSVKSKTYFGKEMSKVMEKFKTKKVDADVINRIPSKDVVGVLALNVDPAGIKEFLKATGFDGMVNAYLGDMGFSLDELLQATSGEFIVAVTDLKMKKEQVTKPAYFQNDKPYSYTRTTPDMRILFASSVNDQKSYEKLLGILKENMGDDPAIQKINYKVSKDWFVASSHSETVDGFLAGGNNKIPFADKLSGSWGGLYVDLQKFYKARSGDAENAYDSAQYNASVNLWQDVIATGSEYRNGTMTVDMTINLVDKSTNSLKQFNVYAQKLAAAKKLRASQYPDVVLSDSTETMDMVPPVIDLPKSNK